jgi:hypothetical protein
MVGAMTATLRLPGRLRVEVKLEGLQEGLAGIRLRVSPLVFIT